MKSDKHLMSWTKTSASVFGTFCLGLTILDK